MNTDPDSGESVVAALGLGGNLGDPAAAMAQALRDIDAGADNRVIAVSRLYRTPPWGKTDQPDFFNCCALVETRLPALALLDLCQQTEARMKRQRLERWGPRTLDIDILTYGNVTMRTERLNLPHPRMTERGFVMVPLAEIAPELSIYGRRAADWLTGVERAGITTASADGGWWRAG